MTSVRSLHDLVVGQAARTPGATAVRQWDRTLTYGELVGAAGALADRLRAAGVRPETRVGVCGRRTPDLLVSVLGIMMAGGAYVPLDPSHPPARLRTIIEDAGIGTVVADDTGRELLAGAPVRLTGPRAETAAEEPPGRPGDGGSRRGPAARPAGTPVPPSPARPDQAAYVLYTSGSTGRPKGVVVGHAAAVSFVTMAGELFGLDSGCRSIGFAALGFDVSVLDVFAPLARGGSVMFVPDGDRTDPARLQRFLEHHEVTWGTLPPALLPLLDPDRLPLLRDLLTAGEPAGPEQVARWSRPGVRRFHNWYGPTETTVCVVGGELTGSWDRPLPIGHALPGCTARILDDRLAPCPPGTPGELCIAGPQLARGYLGRPALTAERFVADPYGPPGSRLYRTGDRVVLEADGRIGFLGRLDRQVKVQGQRVEIGEIESVLRAHPDVGHAVVDLDSGPGGLAELTAYLAPESAPGPDGVRDHCLARLPVYMVPTRVVRLPSLPLTVAGKVDLARLRSHGEDLRGQAHGGEPRPRSRGEDPRGQVRGEDFRGHEDGPPAGTGPAAQREVPSGGRRVPRDAVERAVAAVWSRTFEVPEPGLDDDFFTSGGHSLLAMHLVAGLRAELRREIAVEDVLAGRTVEGLALRAGQAPPIEDAPVAAAAPVLTAAQRRMWFVERLAPGTPVHNIAMAQRLTGPLDTGALRAALSAVSARHEVLRWRIEESGGVPRVVVDPAEEVALPVDSGTAEPFPEPSPGPSPDGTGRAPEADGAAPEAPAGARADGDLPERVRAWLEEEARTPFDLAAGPLWRARLLRLAPGDHVLAVTAHHIVFDGWSQDVLYDDIARAYRGDPPAPLPASFAGYAAWLAAREDTAALERRVEQLGGAPAVLDLPRDLPRPAVQTFEGAAARAEADAETCAGVRALAARLGATPYAVMLSAFTQVMRRLTGQSEMIVGTPVADRRDPAFEPLVGCLVQVVPVRLAVTDEAGFAGHVTACQRELSRAFAHLDVRLERLVERLGAGRDLSRNPLIQVLFNMYDFTEPRLDLPGVSARPLPPGLPGSLFDLTLYVGERGGRYVFQAVYNPRLFHAGRIEALLAGYVHLLGELVAAPEPPVRLASMRPPGAPLPGTATAVSAGARPAASAVSAGAPPGPAADGLVERVLARAAEHPGRIAVTGAGGELTYGELAALVTRTAAATAAAAGPGQAVAVLAARRVELPALLLGVLAAGARWAVLDPALPPARLAAQAAAVDARALLCCPGTVPPPELAGLPPVRPLPPGEGRTEALPGEAGAETLSGGGRDQETGPYPGPVAPAGERGYLSFTSGSTGDPKPVRAAEGPLARFLDWYPGTYGLTGRDRFALLAGLAHDPLLRDAFTPLVLGGTLHVPDQDDIRDPARLAAWLRDRAVTVAHLTPQLAVLVAAAGVPLPDLRLVLLGGDRLTWAQAARFREVAPGARLLNAYGTTETPQVQAVYEITGGDRRGRAEQADHGGRAEQADPGGRAGHGGRDDRGDAVPVGHGIAGAELLVLAGNGLPAAVGELGEVVVRSRRLAEGYLDERLTEERFTLEGDGETGRYRTGDLGRYDPAGRVVLAGRADGQVKIRGHRVELGEIEGVLMEHPDVRAAAAAVADRSGGPVLRAYAVPAGAGVRPAALRRHLGDRLPAHAVPAEVVLLPALPLTPNGKVDRAALPEPAPRPAGTRADEPSGATERLVAGVWREVLGLPRISAGENFFEIGGHSLATAEVQARLAALLGRAVPIVDLFRFPTVRSLAAHLDGAGRTPGPERASRRIAARQVRTPSRRAPSRRPHPAGRQENEE
ncbi:non-ribosomal peptide synthetase [Planomonospora sphaerica]|uniref:Non-ribosomal peptide synthetase n=1 Tax=Planomonospora sphaerica TaxID=161355 RepID=A0A161LK27_9ACTN|nr:non-ribosomal peptide synthetase [Planomonospora sphaerica]GAT69454.1 non-ribosomal peptide synthetase [Planomonospora sphaerica]